MRRLQVFGSQVYTRFSPPVIADALSSGGGGGSSSSSFWRCCGIDPQQASTTLSLLCSCNSWPDDTGFALASGRRCRVERRQRLRDVGLRRHCL
jgi:hypothetical protein